MKLVTSIAALSALNLTAAHSWLHCTNHDNTNILEWMKTNATVHGKDHVVDPLMPWFAHLCHGWPRSKQNPGDWVDETKHYLWDLQLAAHNGDTHACHPDQRAPTQYLASSVPGLAYHKNPAPMATASASSKIKLMFGGNGHSRGANAGGNGNAGIVSVYWAGAPETEIVSVNELKHENLVQENGFSEESFAFPENVNVRTPTEGLVDKGNWQTVVLPKTMQKGRHMMVWVWSFGGSNRFSTCFDVMIK